MDRVTEIVARVAEIVARARHDIGSPRQPFHLRSREDIILKNSREGLGQ